MSFGTSSRLESTQLIMAQVFISHSSADLEAALQVSEWLKKAGHRVFLDRDLESGLRVGDLWRDRLYDEIRRADALVCMVSEAFTASPWCSAEVGIALAYGVRLLPVRVQPDANHPLVSAGIQWLDLTGCGEHAELAKGELVEALRRIDPGSSGRWSVGRSPFPGLRAFDANMAQVFFGRKAETRRLAERLRAYSGASGDTGMLCVVGPSGCGKSSLVRAGLLAVFSSDPAWLVAPPLFPGADPAVALARALAIAGRRRGLGWSTATIATVLTESGGFSGLVDDLIAETAAERLLIVVDQAEELLTRAPESAARHFAGLLKEVTAGRVRVVATLRSDYLDPLSRLSAEVSLPLSTFLLAPFSRDMLPQVILGPARQARIAVDDELVARLVADTGAGEALPLLAFVLERLADEIEPGGSLSAARYDLLGGVHGALAGQADMALAAACAVTGRTTSDVLSGLLRLVTVDQAGHATRRRVDLASLPSDVRDELEEFVVRRLLSIDSDGDRAVLSVNHEHILTAWLPLAMAIGQAAESLRLRAAVENDAEAWQRRDRPPNHLWELDRAASAARSLDAADITPTAWDFLSASREHGRRRRLRLVAVLIVLLLLVSSGGITALIQWRGAVQHERATERARLSAVAEGLIARAEATRGADPRAALRYGTAADAIAPSALTKSNLLHTLATAPRLSASLEGHSGAVRSVAFAGDGTILATGSDDRTVILWNTRDPTHSAPLGAPLQGHIGGSVRSVSFAHDGNIVATGGDDGTIILWDVRNPSRPSIEKVLHGHSGAVRSTVFT
ncbi:TIR domain-containing protein, partial [Frankia sp. Cj3]|uniref:nSTAND1 domain-containing NTPase n=1 Tax=Frankia sp. Cj3 TaxID=2880976 RepID=UPI001EF448DB